MEKLKELISRCKASVTISVNEHRDFYETVQDTFRFSEDREDIDDEIFNEMVRTDTVVVIQFYPTTPIGFYRVYHYDLEKAIDRSLEILNSEK